MLTCLVCPLARHEQGEYFSLDLGGSNLRVMFVKLSREHGQVVGTRSAKSRYPGTGLRPRPGVSMAPCRSIRLLCELGPLGAVACIAGWDAATALL